MRTQCTFPRSRSIKLRSTRQFALPKAPSVYPAARDVNRRGGWCGKFTAITQLKLPVIDDPGIGLALVLGHEFRSSREARVLHNPRIAAVRCGLRQLRWLRRNHPVPAFICTRRLQVTSKQRHFGCLSLSEIKSGVIRRELVSRKCAQPPEQVSGPARAARPPRAPLSGVVCATMPANSVTLLFSDENPDFMDLCD